MEQQLAAALGERQVAEFVEDNEVDPAQGIGSAALTVDFDLGFEPVDQIDDIEEPRLASGPDAVARNADRDVAFARAGRTSATMPGAWDLRLRFSTRSIPGVDRRFKFSVVNSTVVSSISLSGSLTAR